MQHSLPPLHSASSYLQHSHHQAPSPPNTPSYNHHHHGYYNNGNNYSTAGSANNSGASYHHSHNNNTNHSTYHHSAVSSMNGGSPSSAIYHSSSSLYGSSADLAPSSGSLGATPYQHSHHHIPQTTNTPGPHHSLSYNHHSSYNNNSSSFHGGNATSTSSQPPYYGNAQEQTYNNYQNTNYSSYNNNVQTPIRRSAYEESTPITVVSSDEEESHYKSMKTTPTSVPKPSHQYGLHSPSTFQSTPPSASFTNDLNSPSSLHHQYQPSYTSSNSAPSSNYYQHNASVPTTSGFPIGNQPAGSLEDKFLSMRSSLMITPSRRSPSPPLLSPRLNTSLPPSSANTHPSYAQPSGNQTSSAPPLGEPLKNSRKAFDEMMMRLQRDRETLQQYKSTDSYPSTSYNFTSSSYTAPYTQHDSYYSKNSYTPQYSSNYNSKYDEPYRNGSYYNDEYSTPTPPHGSQTFPYSGDSYYNRGGKYPPQNYQPNPESISDDAYTPRPLSPNNLTNGTSDKKKHPPLPQNKKKPPTVTKKPKHKIPPPPTNSSNGNTPPNTTASVSVENGQVNKKLKTPKPTKKKGEPTPEANANIDSKNQKSSLNLRVRTTKQKKRQQDAVRMLKQDDSDNEMMDNFDDEKQEVIPISKITRNEEEKSKELEEKELEMGEDFMFSHSSMLVLSEAADMTVKCTDYINFELEKRGLKNEQTTDEQEIIDLTVYNIVAESKKPLFVKTSVSNRKPHKKYLKISADNINSSLLINDSGETIKKGLLKKGPGLDIYEILCASKLEKLEEDEIRRDCESNQVFGPVEYSDSEDEPKSVNLRSDNTGLKSILNLIENNSTPIKAHESLFSANMDKVLEMYSLKKKSIQKDVKFFERIKPANVEPRVEPSPKKKSSPKRSVPEPKKKDDDQKSKKRKFDVLKKYNTRNGSKD